MEILKEMVKDLAIIGLLAAFIELLVPEGRTKYPLRMIFGLYIIAVMLNPVLTLFQKADLSALDFSAIEVAEIGTVEKADQEEAALQEAAAAMATDIDAALGALFEDCSFQTAIILEKNGEMTAEVTVSGAAKSREVALSGEIKRWLASEYGMSQRKTKIYFK